MSVAFFDIILFVIFLYFLAVRLPNSFKLYINALNRVVIHRFCNDQARFRVVLNALSCLSGHVIILGALGM